MTRDDSTPQSIPQEEDLSLEPEVPPEQHWEPVQEEEWSEHTATAWTLAHIIHRIYSTPLPPVLSPEQRRHFQKIIKMAAALIEEWQQREREQAQQLAAERHPPTFEQIQEAIEAEVANARHPTRP